MSCGMFSENFRARTSPNDSAGWRMRTRPEWSVQRLALVLAAISVMTRSTQDCIRNRLPGRRHAVARSAAPGCHRTPPEGDPVFVDRRQTVLCVEAVPKAPPGDQPFGASELSLLSSFSVISVCSSTSVAAQPELRQMMERRSGPSSPSVSPPAAIPRAPSRPAPPCLPSPSALSTLPPLAGPPTAPRSLPDRSPDP